MKNSTKRKITAAGMLGAGIFTAATLFGCKDPVNTPKPKLCECPNGTVHEEPCECDGEDCTCTVREKILCECPNGTVHDEPCACEGEDCNCTVRILCECPAGTTHEPGEKCCEGENCACEIAEPATKSFTINLFEGATATVQDARTKCGSANLQEMGITKQLEDAINGAFDAGKLSVKGKFRVIFSGVGGNKVIIIIDNPTTSYDTVKTPGKYEMNIHVDYLKNNPVDIQQNVTDAVSVMREMPAVQAKLFSKKILAQLPQSRTAISQRFAMNRLMMRQRG